MKQKGFTLIELLIAITIIAIMVAVLIPNILKSKDLANETAAKNDLISINLAEAAYYSTHLRFGSMSELNADGFINPQRCSSNTCKMAGYDFKLVVTPDSYKVLAVNGDKTFCSNPIGEIDSSCNRDDYGQTGNSL